MHPMSVALHATPLAATSVPPRHVAANGRVRVAVIGATGYVGGELVRWLAGHPAVADRRLWSAATVIAEPIGRSRPAPGADRPASTPRCRRRTRSSSPCRTALAAAVVPGLAAARPGGRSTWAPTSACATRPTTRAGTTSSIPRRSSWRPPSTACRSCIAPSSSRPAPRPGPIVAAPGCYATAAILALAPLARAGLLGDVVVDGKSGVSGAGREPTARPHLRRGQRERHAPTASTGIATWRRWSRSSARSPQRPRRARSGRRSCPTSCR